MFLGSSAPGLSLRRSYGSGSARTQDTHTYTFMRVMKMTITATSENIPGRAARTPFAWKPRAGYVAGVGSE